MEFEFVRNAISFEGVRFGLLAYGGFIVALFVATLLLPGKNVLGQPGPEGKRKRYRLNGMSLFVATHMFLFVGTFFGGLSLTPLLREFWSLFVAANVITLVWLVAMYRAGQRRLAAAGTEPEHKGTLARLWYGIELDPELLGVDLKVFAYQPSLLGLGVLNVAFAYAQMEQLGYLTPQMWAYQLCWWLYLASHYHHESGILSMWDIIAEKFGFMLLWGDLVLVPFFYCIAGWWVLANPHSMSIFLVLPIIGLNLLGLTIFRGSNAQKNAFKADKNTIIWGEPARALGGRLLVSGWWGIGRKINYTGEIMVYTGFALCSGLSSIVPFLLPLWLCGLLSHRAWRDEQRCAAKYGSLWTEYCRVAKFRMIPGLY